MKKLAYQDFRTAMDQINTTGYAANYTLGALQFLLADVASQLPRHKQAELMESLKSLKNSVDEKYGKLV
jgi:hypothetical protein